MTAERAILIRHGQTDWNAEHRWQGMIAGVPLNAEGRSQAQALADYLAANPMGIAALYTSDLLRAWETATIIGEALRITPQPNTRWREVNVGVFQGLTWLELEAQYPHYVDEYRARGDEFHYPEYRFPEGESWLEVQARALDAFEAAVSQANGNAIAVVSHGGVIRNLLRRLLSVVETSDGVRLPNTSITTLEREGRGWRLVEMGATPHLNGGRSDNGRLV